MAEHKRVHHDRTDKIAAILVRVGGHVWSKGPVSELFRHLLRQVAVSKCRQDRCNLLVVVGGPLLESSNALLQRQLANAPPMIKDLFAMPPCAQVPLV